MTDKKEMKEFMIDGLKYAREQAEVYLNETRNEILNGNISRHYLERLLEELIRYERDIAMIDMALAHRDKLKYAYYAIFYED